MFPFLIACLLALLAVGAPQAARIALYDDPAWIAAGTPTASADALAALLINEGHSLSRFSGLSGANVSAGLSGADLVLFPEMLTYGNLAANLDHEAVVALGDFVSDGGGLIAVGDYAYRLLNTIFHPACDFISVYCFAGSGSMGDNALEANVALGTPYAGAPATLAAFQRDAINAYAFFPLDGLNLYRDPYDGTTVMTARSGAGGYGYFAWGFDGSVPVGTRDGGWADLLGIMVSDLAAVPMPPTALLLVGALPLALRRQRSASRGFRRVANERKNAR